MIAIIGGTGFGSFLGLTDIISSRIETQYGWTYIERGLFLGQPIIFLPRHGHPPKIPPHSINYQANIQALGDIEVDYIVALNAVGSIDESLGVPSLIIPDQIIDYTHGRLNTFYQADIKHIDFTFPFDSELRQELIRGVQGGVDLKENGVYGCTQGPRLETAAEVRRMRKDGCDVVGMTLMPEASLARELSIPYASICFVVNRGAGIGNNLITFEAINLAIETSSYWISEMLANVIKSKI